MKVMQYSTYHFKDVFVSGSNTVVPGYRDLPLSFNTQWSIENYEIIT